MLLDQLYQKTSVQFTHVPSLRRNFHTSNFSSIFIHRESTLKPFVLLVVKGEKPKRRSKLHNEKLYANLYSYNVINELCVAGTRSGKRETSPTGSDGKARAPYPNAVWVSDSWRWRHGRYVSCKTTLCKTTTRNGLGGWSLEKHNPRIRVGKRSLALTIDAFFQDENISADRIALFKFGVHNLRGS